ncbi:hypothetical protein OHB12_16755 [Nocardia sp. NBC_01730]|uniref:hypothetical protein n=1 Tax=Nocardia sp. NBC_01730 TaxID=2975998 RepID=UPI002E11BC52|nr:hypothetical protein OHB12_16755 [Nocardia sp. NBC_01730]
MPLETVARLDLARPGDALLFRTHNDTSVTAYHYKNAWQPALRRLSRRDFTLFTKRPCGAVRTSNCCWLQRRQATRH